MNSSSSAFGITMSLYSGFRGFRIISSCCQVPSSACFILLVYFFTHRKFDFPLASGDGIFGLLPGYAGVRSARDAGGWGGVEGRGVVC